MLFWLVRCFLLSWANIGARCLYTKSYGLFMRVTYSQSSKLKIRRSQDLRRGKHIGRSLDIYKIETVLLLCFVCVVKHLTVFFSRLLKLVFTVFGVLICSNIIKDDDPLHVCNSIKSLAAVPLTMDQAIRFVISSQGPHGPGKRTEAKFHRDIRIGAGYSRLNFNQASFDYPRTQAQHEIFYG